MLNLGPRTKQQFESLNKTLKVNRIPPSVQLFRSKYCHLLHRLALYIAENVVDPQSVASLPASEVTLALLRSRRRDPFVENKVQFLPSDCVRAKTPLLMHNLATLEEGILKANIKGHKLVDLAAEYAAACADVALLVQQNKIFTDTVTCWHTDTVPALRAEALLKWESL